MITLTYLPSTSRPRAATATAGVAATVMCAVALAACSPAEEKSAEPRPTTQAESSSAIQPQSLTQDQQQTSPLGATNPGSKTQAPGAPGKLIPTSIRVGSHNGFDRVVIELEGEGTPGWFANYSKSPTQQASGRPLNVAGQSFLNLNIDGTTYPFEQGVEQNLDPTKGTGPVVAEVVSGGTFEGRSQFLIGINGENLPYSVSALTNPTRVVIDIKQY